MISTQNATKIKTTTNSAETPQNASKGFILAFSLKAATLARLRADGCQVFTICLSPDFHSISYKSAQKEISPFQMEAFSGNFGLLIAQNLGLVPLPAAKALLYEAHRVLAPGARAFCLGDIPKNLRLFCQRTFNCAEAALSDKNGLSFAKKGLSPESSPTPEFALSNLSLSPEPKALKPIKPPKNTQSTESSLSQCVRRAMEILLREPEMSQAFQLWKNFPAKKTAQSLAPKLKRKERKQFVSAVSLGLPNSASGAPFFDDGNFQRLFDGGSFLENLSGAEMDALLRRRVAKMVKEGGRRTLEPVCSREKMFGVVSRLGRFDLHEEFGVPRFMVDGLDKTSELAIAAGIKVLQNAKIPLEKSPEHPFGLPQAMRRDTGIVFASSFPQVESSVKAATAFMAHKARLAASDPPEGENPYAFDRKLLLRLLVLANNQLAQLTGASGPNTCVNAACASMAQAIAIASDWLRLGHAKRVLVVAADNATSENLLPLIGNAFLALGASCTKKKISEAAVPFDERRSGMILGMGAAGVLLESRGSCSQRRGSPLAQLVHAQYSNSAFHGALLDKAHIAFELERFVCEAESRLGVSRASLAQKLLYFAHETGTSKGGGCALAEVEALRAVFGAHSRRILVCAVKGQTGHPMGVGFEDAVAVQALASGRAPPVPNWRQRDARLGDVLLSRGGTHSRRFALRMAAGFGSQLVFLLYKKFSENKCALI